MTNLSRRGLLKGALGIGAAAAGSRIIGPWESEAKAAGEPSHFVHIFFHGGINAFFTGCADMFRGKFGITSPDAVKPIGNGIHTDAGTFGSFDKFALDHWAAIGFRHGDANHTVPENRNAGGEMAVVRNGNNNYLTQLAAAMGGDSAFKAVLLGRRSQDYGVYARWPAVNGVALERISNLKDALSSVGAEKPNPNAPDRVKIASTLEAAQEISARQIATNPGRLGPLAASYDAAVDSLKKPLPPPVTFDEVDKAYGLGGRTTITPGGATSFAAQFALAEIMIRAGGSNVIHISDFEPMWDADAPVNGARSLDGFLGRSSLHGRYNRINPIKTFLSRMLNFPGRNVVVAISGEFVRAVANNHGHGAGVVAAVFGKNIKQGRELGGLNDRAQFPGSAPGTKDFWAGIAAACGVTSKPFGANPYKLLGA